MAAQTTPSITDIEAAEASLDEFIGDGGSPGGDENAEAREGQGEVEGEGADGGRPGRGRQGLGEGSGRNRQGKSQVLDPEERGVEARDEGEQQGDPDGLDDDDEFLEEEEDEEFDDDLDDLDDDEEVDTPDDDDEEQLGDDETYTVKVDGEEFDVTLEELKKGYSREAKFTQEMQELRAYEQEVQQREEEANTLYERVASWYEEQASDPAKFAADIIANTQDPTYTTALVLKQYLGGSLDQRFRDLFQIDANDGVVGQTLDQGQLHEEVNSLRQQIESQQQQQAAASREQEIVKHYLGQWNEVKQTYGIEFEDAGSEREAWNAVIQHAARKEIVDLHEAYKSLAFEQQFQRQQQEQQQNGAASKTGRRGTTTKQKRASRGASRHGSGGARKAPQTPPKPVEVEEAAGSVVDEFFSR